MAVTGRIASVVVMVAVGVVLRVHRTHLVTWRRHRRTETVVVVAVVTRTGVVARTRPDVDHHPALVARSFPVEGDGLEVLEGGEAVELVAQLVVGHDGEGTSSPDALCRNVDGDALDAAGTYFHPLLGVAVAVVRIEVDDHIAPVGVVTYIFDVIIDGNGRRVVHHHRL